MHFDMKAFGPLGKNVPQVITRGWRLQVLMLMGTSALSTPALLLTAGYLQGGQSGALITLFPATALYAGLLLNDHLILREASAGKVTWPSIAIRSLIPIGGTTLLAIIVLSKLFAPDISAAITAHEAAIVVPLKAKYEQVVDGAIHEAVTRAERAEAAREALAAERKAKFSQMSAAQNEVIHLEAVMKCEAIGSQCFDTSSGKAGTQGPISNSARIRKEAAEKTVARLKEEIATTSPEIVALDGSGEASALRLRQNAERLKATREETVHKQIDDDPAAIAVRAANGPGERLALLATIVLQKPALLIYALAGKIVTTAFELLGVMRGRGIAKSDPEVFARKSRYERARQSMTWGIWKARQEVKASKAFEKQSGLEALLRRSSVDETPIGVKEAV
jgi:hypothetical protein